MGDRAVASEDGVLQGVPKVAVTLEPPSSRTWCCLPPNMKPHGPSPEEVKPLLVVQHHSHAHGDSLPNVVFIVCLSSWGALFLPRFSPLDPPQPTEHDTELCTPWLCSLCRSQLFTTLTRCRVKGSAHPFNRWEGKGSDLPPKYIWKAGKS